MKSTRALLPMAAVAALLLVGCSNGNANDPKGVSDCLPEGKASHSVQVEGEFGEALTLTSKTPVQPKGLERTVIIPGKGVAPQKDQEVTIALTFFSGKDGAVLQHGEPEVVANTEENLNEWAHEIIRCSASGQRVALAGTANDFFGGPADEVGLAAGDPVIAVFDVVNFAPGTLDTSKLPTRADGAPQPAPAGFPTVTLADDGSPTITIPEGLTPPTELKVGLLKKGTGEVVEAGDRVYVQYRGIIWRTGEEFDSSWKRGGVPIGMLTTEVIGGFAKALEGQTVGSQVISVVPWDQAQGGYGAEQLIQMGHLGDDTMVFVLDVVGVSKAS